MKLATWNVNSIRTRYPRVIDFLAREDVDILAMQETKCKPEQFPLTPFQEAGYQVVCHGLNQWNGVAIASRLPIEHSEIGFANMPAWGETPTLEARALSATITVSNAEPVTVYSLYVPNGRELSHPHYQYKLDWLAALRDDAQSWLEDDSNRSIALVGDWNVAPLDSDVWDMEVFAGATHVSAPERAAFFAFQDAGYLEVTRDLVDGYTYWDYQKLRFPRNEGMRIDFMYASPAFAARVRAAHIDRDERKGKGASDHVPVIVEWD